MTERQHDPQFDRPVLNGLVALLAVALGVGLILALVAVVGARVLGLGGDSGGGSADSAVRDTMSIPESFAETEAGGPRITLATEETDEPAPTTRAPQEPSSSPSETKSPKEGRISLSTGQTAVGAGDRIDLIGTYPGGEGAILQVQRFEGGGWEEFPATVGVSNETFSTYIFTGVSGVNRFRVIDNSTGTASNEIRVRVG